MKCEIDTLDNEHDLCPAEAVFIAEICDLCFNISEIAVCDKHSDRGYIANTRTCDVVLTKLGPLAV